MTKARSAAEVAMNIRLKAFNGKVLSLYMTQKILEEWQKELQQDGEPSGLRSALESMQKYKHKAEVYSQALDMITRTGTSEYGAERMKIIAVETLAALAAPVEKNTGWALEEIETAKGFYKLYAPVMNKEDRVFLTILQLKEEWANDLRAALNAPQGKDK